MFDVIQAVYENGVLRPLHTLGLREHEKVTITVFREQGDWLDTDIVEAYSRYADDSVTLNDVRDALSCIKGSLDDAIDEDRGPH